MNELAWLKVPPQYAQAIGGPNWTDDCDAIADAHGRTVVLTGALAQFIEGACRREPPVAFGFVLHFAMLLRDGGDGKLADLRAAFAEHASWRNAGLLFAHLTRALPRAPGEIRGPHIATLLRGTELRPVHWLARAAQSPPLAPDKFAAHLRGQLEAMGVAELRHWLRHGRGSVAPLPAVELPPAPPRRPGNTLDELLLRKRLTGVAPFLDQLVSAITLPPRRVMRAELPVGGYSSVTNRGHPDQILPGEYAVDELEFLRRFAGNELLYWQREEPQSQVREDMIVLLDQGVRTWGVTRLMLSAAAIALLRRAETRGLHARVAATSREGEPLEPHDSALGEMLEASDLSPDPGLSLERVLEEPALEARDVVLLTHPRNLLQEDVQTAARRAPAQVRVFALAVDERGQAELHEFKRGAPVLIRAFRLQAPKPEPAPEAEAAAPSDAPWQGDIAGVPMPFRFGLVANVEHMCLDAEGQRLLTVSSNQLAHVWSHDGKPEPLPRPQMADRLRDERVCGVRGGFARRMGNSSETVVVHTNTVARSMRVHAPAREVPHLVLLGYSEPEHSVVLMPMNVPESLALDLDTGEFSPPSTGSRADSARRRVIAEQTLRPRVQLLAQPAQGSVNWDGLNADGRVALLYQPRTGRIALLDGPDLWRSWVPMADGVPMLKESRMIEARCAGGVLVLRVASTSTVRAHVQERVLVFRGPEWRLIGDFPVRVECKGLDISLDGATVAFRENVAQVAVLDVRGDHCERRFTAERAKVHGDLLLECGRGWFTVYGGKFTHLLRWDRDRLEISFVQGKQDIVSMAKRQPDLASLPTASVRAKAGLCTPTRAEPERFKQFAASRSGMLFATDAYGQVAVFGRDDALVAMFFIYRGSVAAWLPDGTRYGPAGITGAPTAPGALQKIGAAMKAAESGGRP
jgi:hypothetical protein